MLIQERLGLLLLSIVHPWGEYTPFSPHSVENGMINGLWAGGDLGGLASNRKEVLTSETIYFLFSLYVANLVSLLNLTTTISPEAKVSWRVFLKSLSSIRSLGI
jgi:hypothetical protein